MENKSKYKVNHKYNLKMYLSFLKNYKIIVGAVFIVVLISEVLAWVNKYLFKILVDKSTLYYTNALSHNLFVTVLLTLLAVYFVSSIFRSIMMWCRLHLIHKIETGLMYDIKKKFFNHILHLSHSFHTSHRTGSLISRIIRGATATERMTDFVCFNILPLLFEILIIATTLIYINWVTLLIIAGIAILFIANSLIILRLQDKANVRANEAEDYEKGNMSDIFTNIDSIKYFGKEGIISRKFDKLSKNSRNLLNTSWNYYRWFDSINNIIISLGLVALIYLPIKQFMAGEITLGTLVFVYTIYGSIIEPLYGFVHGVRGYFRSMTDFEDLFRYGKIDQDVKDQPDAQSINVKKGEIEFKNIDFKYHSRDLFKDFNLKVNPGEKVALVGHSGSGKSTLVKLLYRFYNLKSGEILIDGRNINEFKQESLRSELSIVPQEAVLFNDTIYNNILFSRPDATYKEVMHAMKSAQLDKVVSNLPNKENTIVGERGVKLSGGEKQRVSIARAILANKRIIVLDEATSSLDSHTEHEIQKDLQNLLKGRTSIIIAHRLSTIMHADKIVVLDKGKIVQIGSHNELIRKQGLYRKLWNLQKGGYLQD